MSANADNRRVARNTLILYFRMLFQMAVFLYTSRVLIRVMGVENYGLYDVVGGIVFVLMFLNNAMATATQRFITVALGRGDKAHLRDVYSVASILHLLLGIGVVVIGALAGGWYILHLLTFPAEKLTDVLVVFGCSLSSGMLMIVSVPSVAAIIAHEDMSAYAGITILDVLLKLCATLALYLVPPPLMLMAYGGMMLAEAIIVRAVYWLYCRRRYPALALKWVSDGQLYREVLSFMGWNTFGNLSLVANTHGLNLMLNYFGGPVVNAARGVAFQVQTAVTSFISSFQTAINPQITKSYSQGDSVRTNWLVLTSSRLSFLLMLFMALPLGIETEFVLRLWLGSEPTHAASFIRLLLCVSLVDCVANPMMVAAAATGRVRRYYLVVGLTMLTTLPIGFAVVKWLGAVEWLFATLLATTLLTQMLRMMVCRGLFGLSLTDFMKQVFGRIAATGLATVAPLLWLHGALPLESWWSHVGFCLLILAWTALVAAGLGLTATERSFVRNKLMQRLRKA